MLVQLHTRKNEPALATDLWGIVASTELPQSEFLHFKNNLLDDYPFIEECAERLHGDENGIVRGLLVLCKDSDDGILVNSEGRSYAKDSAYLPGARSLVLLNNHPSLKDFCTQMTGLVDKYVLDILDRQSGGEAEISYQEIDYDDTPEGFSIPLFLKMLAERPEIQLAEDTLSEIRVVVSELYIQNSGPVQSM